MLKKKPSTAEKKRKHSQSEERSGKRRSSESHFEDSKDELADPELDKIGSDIEEGGLDLSLPFQPITAYIGDKQEMLEQCFRVLGEKKLRKMLPDELKDCGLVEIKALCWKLLEPICEKTLLHILAGEDLTPGNGNSDGTLENQQDNNVDSTSCFRETGKNEYAKQEGGVSGEESDVLSINADTYDSDIEGPKEEQTAKAADATARVGDGRAEGSDRALNPEPKKDIQSDIDKSVSEILAFSSTLSKDEVKEAGGQPQSADISSPGQAGPPVSGNPAVSQPSVQQLALLELEMRARAIKALMKAGDGKKLSKTKNI